jgi:hypothetical protein
VVNKVQPDPLLNTTPKCHFLLVHWTYGLSIGLNIGLKTLQLHRYSYRTAQSLLPEMHCIKQISNELKPYHRITTPSQIIQCLPQILQRKLLILYYCNRTFRYKLNKSHTNWKFTVNSAKQLARVICIRTQQNIKLWIEY